MTTITWTVVNMVSEPKPNVDDFVLTVNCSVTATDGKYKKTDFQSGSFEYDGGVDYNPYSTITESDAISWVKAQMGPDKLKVFENSLIQQVEFMANPPKVVPSIKPLPWANS